MLHRLIVPGILSNEQHEKQKINDLVRRRKMNQRDDNQLQTIQYVKQVSALKDLDRAGEVALRPVNMERRNLHIPPLLTPKHEDDNHVHYELKAQKGETDIIGGKTNTYGYNGDFLGTTMKLKQGQTVTIDTTNDLDETITYHWHGMIVQDEVDGETSSEIETGGDNTVSFDVLNEAGTYWFHPHPHHISAEQIYRGLTGLIINEDENSERLEDILPHEYGTDDIPLIIWDRFFDEEKEFVFEDVYASDGNRGDTLLLNGTAMPKIDVHHRYVRLRFLNAANVTNFRIALSNGATFYQIATDGGFLNHPVGVDQIVLSPAERAEVVIDLKDIADDRLFIMMNEFEALEMNIKDKQEKVKFSPNNSLRKEILPMIEVKDIADLQTKLFMISGTDENVSINNMKFDMERIDERQTKGEYYVWRIMNVESEDGGMVHNFHTHGTQFRIIARNGNVPPKNEL